MDVEKLSAELSKRQSRMWQVIDPHAMAEWVFGDPELVEPLDALPAAAPLLDGVRAALGSDLDTASYRSLALGVAGVVIRATVPAAAQTGSAHWLLTEHVRPDWEWIRLTVGVSEVLIAGWSDEELEVTLRLAASPIEDAFRRRVLDEATLKELGVERVEDNLRSFGDDAVRYRCQDLFAAVEFLCLPVVVTAARLMNARLAAGSFPHTPNYDPAVAAEAWAAAEVVFGDEGPFAALDEDLEFDLDTGYRDEDPIETPAPVGTEHTPLDRRLADRLAEAGIVASPDCDGLPVDLAWSADDGRRWIAVVRTDEPADPADRLRIGLGLAIEQRERLAAQDVKVGAVLLVPSVPDQAWHDICVSVDVLLLTADDPASWTALA